LIVAQPPTIVKGYVYINDEITEPEEVHLTFPSQSRIGTVYSDGRYIIVFTDEDAGSVGEFYIIYNGKSYIPSETVIIIENQYVYEIDLYIEAPTGIDDSPDDPVDQTNIQPKAKAGGPYYEIVGESISFDASDSFDSDGTITKYEWDFGDETTANGESTTHSYLDVGNYRVILTVTDNKGKSDLDITYAYITTTPNDPPTQPILNGTLKGSINVFYNYTIFSTDIENNTIQYVLDWGDQTNITSSNLQPNGTIFTANHSWIYPGIYTLTGYAIDENNVVSKKAELVVLIDSIYCGNIGYMFDYTSDGFFDLFYSNITAEESIVEKIGNLYLIDEDNDGGYDYEYNFEINTLGLYSNIETEPEKTTSIFEEIQPLIPYVVFAIAVLLILAIIIFKFNKKTKKENAKGLNKSVNKQVKAGKEKPGKRSEKYQKIEDDVDRILANKK
jgi:PKD repeat protein